MIFILSWLGILAGSAFVIAKGKNIFFMEAGKKLGSQICLDFLKNSSLLYEASDTPVAEASFGKMPIFLAGEEEAPATFAYVYGNKKKSDSTGENADTEMSYAWNEIDYSIWTGDAFLGSENGQEQYATDANANEKIEMLKRENSSEYLLKNFYIIDGTTSADTSLFKVKKMLEKDYSIKKKDAPQILIYHTHGASESFSDSTPNNYAESIVGVGEYLKEVLEEEYGYQVIHDETCYDMIDGKIDRNKAYAQSDEGVRKWMKKYPTIQVLIDLHRDGVAGKDKKIALINGKPTARIMFFNGLSRNRTGPIEYLKNENLFDNLSFSLQLKLAAMEKYPGLTTPNYLKGYRYNLHLAKRALLIELGNQNNTLQEAKNAMEPLADVLDEVLSSKTDE